jgi:drug/metabolite transporter (DMT)-like permease
MSGVAEPGRARAAELALVAIAAVWGLTFVMVQDAVALLPVTAFLAYRFIPAAGLVAIFSARRLRQLTPAGWRSGAAMGVFLTAGYLFQTFGLQHTTASNAGFITGLFVVFTPLLGVVVLRERASGVLWAASAASAVGLFLLSGAGTEFRLAGDGLVLLCALAFAAHILMTDRGVASHPVGALVAVQLGLTGVVCLGVAALAGQLEPPEGATVWSALIVTSLVASALGFFVQSYAQRHASPARTALILASEPAFAGVFGYLLAGDRLVGGRLAGGRPDPGGDRGRRRGPAAAPTAAPARGLITRSPVERSANLRLDGEIFYNLT